MLLDIVDLSCFPASHFDAVVCYGGALSYVFDRADEALAGLLRVTKPGGLVLLSVMSLLGAGRQTLSDVLALTKQYGLADMDRARQTGDIPLGSQKHICRMYRFSSLQALLSRHPCTLVAASASNFLSVGNETVLAAADTSPELWNTLLKWEEDFCSEPGALDGGTHILAAVRRT
jgi:SAM-dependent methyltransferase